MKRDVFAFGLASLGGLFLAVACALAPMTAFATEYTESGCEYDGCKKNTGTGICSGGCKGKAACGCTKDCDTNCSCCRAR